MGVVNSGYPEARAYLGLARVRSANSMHRSAANMIRKAHELNQDDPYETEAASYGLSLLHEIGITDIDAWFSSYTACDQAYLLCFYKTGEKRDFREFWRDEATLIVPKPIPTFVPTRRRSRMNGIVI